MDTVVAPKKRGRPPKVRQVVEESIQASAEYVNQHVLEDVFEPDPPVLAPSRPEMRPAMREEDPRTRAARRSAELRDHRGGDMEEGSDDFYIDLSDIPAGWTYEWKRKLVLGAEDPAYMVALARSGWEAVPTSRHPSYMPASGDYPTIERKGMLLMERPTEITDDARDHEQRKARNQVRQKEAQLNSSEGGQFERSNKDQSLVKINRSYESIPIPKE
tara:strand:+ start:2430 stop:3080 length:651 start_codon:yes stop_codon:yes gene_type:complete